MTFPFLITVFLIEIKESTNSEKAHENIFLGSKKQKEPKIENIPKKPLICPFF